MTLGNKISTAILSLAYESQGDRQLRVADVEVDREAGQVFGRRDTSLKSNEKLVLESSEMTRAA